MTKKMRFVPLSSTFTGSIGVYTGLWHLGPGNTLFTINVPGLMFGHTMQTNPDYEILDYVADLQLKIFVTGYSSERYVQPPVVIRPPRPPRPSPPEPRRGIAIGHL